MSGKDTEMEKEHTETLINADDTTLLDEDRKIKQAKLDDNLRSMKFFFSIHSFILSSPYS